LYYLVVLNTVKFKIVDDVSPMRIINPIYDVAFKYLLEDLDIAKKLISKIIDEEIISLVVQPQEIATESEHIGILILRLDFKATIQTENGKHKTILIELQKAKMYDDLMRFRRYLGKNYSKQVEISTNGTIEKLTLPIITIYFLGFPLPEIDTSVLKISREYVDLINGLKLDVKTEFVEKLTHDSFIILIPKLPPKERTELEGILKVFDQRYQLEANPKLLEINENDFGKNELIKSILTRLQRGAVDEKVLKKMLVEEEVDSAFDKIVRKYEQGREELELKKETIKEQDETIKDQQKLIDELKQQLHKRK